MTGVQTCALPIYREIRRDPIAAIRSVYEYFGWCLSREAEQRMRTTLANQPQEQNGFHHYEPSQFGLEVAEVDARFFAYCERFGLSAQHISRAGAVRLENSVHR